MYFYFYALSKALNRNNKCLPLTISFVLGLSLEEGSKKVSLMH